MKFVGCGGCGCLFNKALHDLAVFFFFFLLLLSRPGLSLCL